MQHLEGIGGILGPLCNTTLCPSAGKKKSYFSEVSNREPLPYLRVLVAQNFNGHATHFRKQRDRHDCDHFAPVEMLNKGPGATYKTNLVCRSMEE